MSQITAMLYAAAFIGVFMFAPIALMAWANAREAKAKAAKIAVNSDRMGELLDGNFDGEW